MLVVLPGAVLLIAGRTGPSSTSGSGTTPGAGRWSAAIVIAAAVLAATRPGGRLKAVMLVGVTGYGTAVLFLLHGAPDLALTQVLVETVTLVRVRAGAAPAARVLHRPAAALASRWCAAGDRARRSAFVVGVGGRRGGRGPGRRPRCRTAFPEAAYTFGGGKNIVNVTLVDIRAWDTMGEISVLVVAATGVASLIFLRAATPAEPPRCQPPRRAASVDRDPSQAQHRAG